MPVWKQFISSLGTFHTKRTVEPSLALTIQKKAVLDSLIRNGCTYDYIMDQVGCSRGTVARRVKSIREEDRKKSEEIAAKAAKEAAKAARLDMIADKDVLRLIIDQFRKVTCPECSATIITMHSVLNVRCTACRTGFKLSTTGG